MTKGICTSDSLDGEFKSISFFIFKSKNRNLNLQPLFPKSPLQSVSDPVLDRAGIRLLVKRDDLIHPLVSGNKWRKLKYNLDEFKRSGAKVILSFGGAYSNHIYSLAAAGKIFGFKTIGIIRGERTEPLNATLSFAVSQGMDLHYLDRETYRKKDDPEFLESLKLQFPNVYILPEGGSNKFALPGCAEIVAELEIPFDYICCAMGTSATMAGISSGAPEEKKILGFPVLKAEGYFAEQVKRLQAENGLEKNNWDIIENYHFGGYAKISRELLFFIKRFEERTGIPLEPVYTGKLFYGIYDLAEKGFFKRGETVVALHSGGLQGLAGMEPVIQKLLKENR